MTGDFGSATTMSKNETFLKAVFGEHDWERAHVCAVAGDPSHKGKGWFGGHAHLMLVDLRDDTNNYFCVSLFTGTRRRENAFQKLVCLAVDDIGPKLDASLVELLLGVPTWIIETSQGNFQWGYVLETPITDAGVASGLIHRVRVALTGEHAKDPGQESVTRYMRLPTGKNLKGSLGKPWDVRIIKLDPGQKLSNKVLDLVPGVVLGQGDKGGPGSNSAGGAEGSSSSSTASRSTKIGVHAADTLLAAMRKLGLVLGGPRETAMGWGFDILCPWVDEHTDRAETGTVYVAGAGKFKCQHGHCADRTVEDVRDKIDKMLKEAGEPGGLIHEEFDVVDPATVPEPPQGVNHISPIEKEFFDRYVWIIGRDMYWDLVDEGFWLARELDREWTPKLKHVLPRIGGSGKKQKLQPPHQYLGQDKRGLSAYGLIKWPGMPRIVAPYPNTPGHKRVNLWKPNPRPLQNAAETDVDERAIKPWLDVYWHVVGGGTLDQWTIGEMILDWLALLIGDMSLKAGWQVVITGPQGIGKDIIVSPLVRTLGDWARTVQSQQFAADFNEWAGGRLAHVSETRQNTRGMLTGHDVMNVLKVVFDTSREWITVNSKYAQKTECRNVIMGWFTSNEREPLRLEPGDRRFLIIDRDGTKPLSPKTYEQLSDWLKAKTPNTDTTGIMRVAEFLYRRWERMDAARKKALLGNAPMTAAKQDMLARLIDPVEDWMRRCIDLDPNVNSYAFPDIVHGGYVHSRLETAITQRGEQLPGGVGLPAASKIGQLLKEIGAEALYNGKPVKVKGAAVVLWAVRNAGLYNKISVPGDLAKLFIAGTSGTSGTSAVGDFH